MRALTDDKNRRDLTDVDLFEREIPFDLGDLSARDDADLYTRDFFETELSERDVADLLERNFDESDLLFERDFEQLEARESIWSKIR